MKKVLVLLLVLGMASAASATMLSYRIGNVDAPSVTLLVGETVDIQLYSSADDAAGSPTYAYTAIAAVAPGDSRTYAKFTATALGAGSQIHGDASISQLLADFAYQLDNSGPTTQVLTAGVGGTFTLEGVALGVGTINLSELAPGSGIVDTLAFEVVVPEPMTMALLGLGGLFLRRRK